MMFISVASNLDCYLFSLTGLIFIAVFLFFRCKHTTCVQKFRSSEALALHTACHKGPNLRQYVCSQCSSKFDDWRHCSIHLWNVHNIDVDLHTCGVSYLS